MIAFLGNMENHKAARSAHLLHLFLIIKGRVSLLEVGKKGGTPVLGTGTNTWRKHLLL